MDARSRHNSAIIVAAGAGKRMGRQTPKAFLQISGKAILLRTLEKFRDANAVDSITVVLPQQSFSVWERMVSSWTVAKLDALVAGGASRQESVWNGLSQLSPQSDIVLIHDGVRPFIRTALIEKSIKTAQSSGAAILGVTPKDTIKTITAEQVSGTCQRSALIAVQTPQAYRYDIIMRAYRHAREKGVNATDDAALVEQIGCGIEWIQGDYFNIKITSPEDILVAETFIQSRVDSG